MHTPVPAPSFRRSLLHAGFALLAATSVGIAACGGGGGGGGSSGEGSLDNDPPSSTGTATVLGAVLNAPWGLAFLPDGRMLVTEKGGALALVSADGSTVTQRLAAPPGLNSDGQGGLLDVSLDSDFASTRWVYLTFSENGAGGTGTALARGQLNTSFDNWQQAPQTIWQQTPKVGSSSVHYGARIAWRSDATMYVAVGERGVEANSGVARGDSLGVQVQTNTIGKVVRLNRNGAPADGSALGIWSGGHRNPQGAAVRPGSNELWVVEHGPRGGDELNLAASGANHGWPLRSYGCDYATNDIDRPGCYIGGGAHAPYAEPKTRWNSADGATSYTATAPSGLMFYDGARFPDWRGNVFAGALSGQTLWRMVLDGSGNVTSRQEIAAVKALGTRIRDVRQGNDGNIYLLTNGSGNNGNRIVRLTP